MPVVTAIYLAEVDEEPPSCGSWDKLCAGSLLQKLSEV